MDAAQHSWRKFADAAAAPLDAWAACCAEPERAQQARLQVLLHSNRDSAFGRQHRFDLIRDRGDWQRRVPLQRWHDVQPWIERISRGESGVLTSEAPRFLEPTSGSSAACKLIPYTPALLREFQLALVVWLAALLRDCPEVALGPSYWAISPPVALQPPRGSDGEVRVPLGGATDAAYIRGSAAECLLPTLLVPAAAADGVQWRQQTLLALLGAETLAMISIWSPTFLSALLRPLLDAGDPSRDSTLSAIRLALPAPRVRTIERAIGHGEFTSVWPQLAVVSCWMDGPSAAFADALSPLLPQARWIPKGLLATEGVVSFSWAVGGSCALAVQSHLLEFIDDRGACCAPHQLIAGKRYRVVLSTGGGLYRYELGDEVAVTGFLDQTPCVRFVGRTDARCDMVGEKLDEALVRDAFAADAGMPPGACLVPLPLAQPARYALLLPSTSADHASGLARRLEAQLCGTVHYQQARELGQLGPLTAHVVEGLGVALQGAGEQIGQRASTIKPSALLTSLDAARALQRELGFAP